MRTASASWQSSPPLRAAFGFSGDTSASKRWYAVLMMRWCACMW